MFDGCLTAELRPLKLLERSRGGARSGLPTSLNLWAACAPDIQLLTKRSIFRVAERNGEDETFCAKRVSHTINGTYT